MSRFHELDVAWNWREKAGWFDHVHSLRVFHGPGESIGEWKNISIDRFGDHAWITEWAEGSQVHPSKHGALIGKWLSSRGIQGASYLFRPLKGVPEPAAQVYGEVPSQPLAVREEDSLFWIKLQGVRHPGLFLDHLQWRRWLKAHAQGCRVLNLFAYTGSLSVAAGRGGASEVVTLDLSKPTVDWAQENWRLNELSDETARFIVADAFSELTRYSKRGEQFDFVILDPPSFSRGEQGTFSTQKDLPRLLSAVTRVLKPGGCLLASINSENVSWERLNEAILMASLENRTSFQCLQRVDLPDTFPTPLHSPQIRYLKGWILRRWDEGFENRPVVRRKK